MPQLITGIHPTRMELLGLKRRRAIAERGRDLLREKLDALMIEFLESVRRISGLRMHSQELLSEAYVSFSDSQVSLGYRKMEGISFTVKDRFAVDASSGNIIGVQVPRIKVNVTPLEAYPYNLLETSVKLDEATSRMAETVKSIAELAGSEAAVRRLAQAIASTKRRVNSLEYIIIPRMTDTIRYIEMRLQEQEREDFFRLKRIKSRLEAARTR